MEINFEHLELLPKILERLEFIEKHLQNNYFKRWLNIKEVAEYTGYSKDRIYKIKNEEWIENYHYYKRTGKLIFDSHAIDKWIIGNDEESKHMKQKMKETVNFIIKSIDTK